MNVIVALALGSLAAAPVPKAEPARDALEALQGEWKFVSFFAEGQPKSKEELADGGLTVSGNKVTSLLGNRRAAGTFTLNQKANPSEIDFKIKEDGEELALKGIFKLERDTLTLSLGSDGDERPKDFKPTKVNSVMVLERVKK